MVDKKVVAQRARPVREDAVLRATDIRTQHAQAADEHGHLGGGQREQLRLVDGSASAGTLKRAFV